MTGDQLSSVGGGTAGVSKTQCGASWMWFVSVRLESWSVHWGRGRCRGEGESYEVAGCVAGPTVHGFLPFVGDG